MGYNLTKGACGIGMDLMVNGQWQPTRIEMAASNEGYLVGVDTETLGGLMVRI
jgi:hypothetical protein